MDIHSLLEGATSASSPGNDSTVSRTSNNSSKKTRDNSVAPSQPLSAGPVPPPTNFPPGPPLDPQFFTTEQQHFPMMQTAHYPMAYPPPPPHYPMSASYASYPPTTMPDPRFVQPMPVVHHSGIGQKRYASGSHPAESPAKKKQTKWTGDEDASIIELRGNGMKWEDISKHLPGRSAISCRLRFQNYLERRSEWDEEKKNKLARLYERYVSPSMHVER